MAGIVVDPLAPRQGYFFVRPGHPLASRRELKLADVAAFPILCSNRLTPAIVERLLDARGPRGAGRSLPDVASESHEMMQRIAATTDHVLLSSLAGNRDALAQGRLVALPVADPVIRVSFAVLRLESRTLPPIADQLLAEIAAADRAAVALERELAAKLAGPTPAPIAQRRATRARPLAAAAASR
jgi:DNA-binding transcriptional LysR family regulator